MLGLLVLEVVLWLAATGGAVAAVAFGLLVSPVVGALAGLLALLLWVIVVGAIRLVFAFAPVVVVVDDTGVAGGIGGGAQFVRSKPIDAVGYSLLAVTGLGVLGTVAALGAEPAGWSSASRASSS